MLQPPRYQAGSVLSFSLVLSYVPGAGLGYTVTVGSTAIGSAAATVVGSREFGGLITLPDSASYVSPVRVASESLRVGYHPYACITWTQSGAVLKRSEFQIVKTVGW